MSNDELRFGDYLIDPPQRRLSRAGRPVELNGRYFDALLLLARNAGELVTKDRFMAEVWRGVPVTDEALTQCIRSLRRTLGDDAARPRFIETVPKHGYRFVAAVAAASDRASAPAPVEPLSAIEEKKSDRGFLLPSAAGLAGGAGAGVVGGIAYGLLAASAPPEGTGAISVLLVLTCLCIAVGALGGLGVGTGIAAGLRIGPGRLFPAMLGGALGGLVAGTIGRLVALDGFALLVGTRPLAITGGGEGMVIGAFAGASLWLAHRRPGDAAERVALIGGGLGALAGLLVLAGGGQMMAGSLAVLAAAHPQAPLGTLVGTSGLPAGVRLASGAVEGATFIAALTLAFRFALRRR